MMTEKVQINGKDLWIIIEPHERHITHDDPKEYFTASYHTKDPESHPGGIMLLTEEKTPLIFDSPVQALEYANEKLLGII
ncbi:MAG: hypothetical protein ABJB86_07205 [Bacteroidota bacterium]